MRGIRGRPVSKEDGRGITPACAGNTGGDSKVMKIAEDHPRVCGEYKAVPRLDRGVEGSPPRVRGIHDVAGAMKRLGRITPACAGNTDSGQLFFFAG